MKELRQLMLIALGGVLWGTVFWLVLVAFMTPVP